MAGRECYHCKQWIEDGDAHDCWTTTEAALTRDLSPDLQDAWERLRETAAEFGEQRIYASLNSIMFSRKACYCFVRPKRNYLELCVFLGRTVKAPQVQRTAPASKTKMALLIRVRHRDEVEAPITDWMREAYEQSEALSARGKSVRPTVAKPERGRVKRANGTQPAAAKKSSGDRRKGRMPANRSARKGRSPSKPASVAKAASRRASGHTAVKGTTSARGTAPARSPRKRTTRR